MKRKILIRFDDICPTMDFVQWERADKLLRKYNIRPLLGVIPECKDPDLKIEPEHEDFWELIKSLERKGYTLAMHGCYHLYRTNVRGMVNNSNHSEFAGLPFEEQYRMICHGKKILAQHKIHTDIFFAPAHSYDENTLRALAKAGFKFISDGKSYKPYKMHGIKCIPCRSEGCPYIKKSGYYTAVFHAHEWSRPEKEVEYHKFQDLLKNYSSDITSFSDFEKIRSGKLTTQKIIEKSYLVYQRYIQPYLSEIKHYLLK